MISFQSRSRHSLTLFSYTLNLNISIYAAKQFFGVNFHPNDGPTGKGLSRALKDKPLVSLLIQEKDNSRPTNKIVCFIRLEWSGLFLPE